MKINAVVSAVLALSMSISGLAFAEGPNAPPGYHLPNPQERGQRAAPTRGMNDSPRENIENRQFNHNNRHDDGRRYEDARRRDEARRYEESRRAEAYRREERRQDWQQRRDYNQRREWQAREYERRGVRPEYRFYRGGRLPGEYRQRQYVIDDWRGRRLNAPPRGYHWVQAGNDYLLVAIATGIIATVLLNQ